MTKSRIKNMIISGGFTLFYSVAFLVGVALFA